jgi:ferredoxin-fold anticodon binding domain-containing protein
MMSNTVISDKEAAELDQKVESGSSLEKKTPAKRTLTNQEKLKIAAIDLISDKQSEAFRKQKIVNSAVGVSGLFFSVAGLSLGVAIFLS